MNNTTFNSTFCLPEIPSLGYVVCSGLPAGALLCLLIITIFCCVYFHIKKKRKDSQSSFRGNVQKTTAPIDLATGQMNQQGTAISTLSKNPCYSIIGKNIDNKNAINSYKSKSNSLKTRAPMVPPPREKTVSVSHEQTTSLSSEPKNISMVNSANSNKLLVSNEPSADSQTHSAGLMKPTLHVKTMEKNPQQEEKEKGSPTFNDIVTPLEMSVNFPCQQTGSLEESQRYHILCDPSEEKKERDISAASHHKIEPDLKQESSFRPHQSSPSNNITKISQQCKHVYELVSAEHSDKPTSTDDPGDSQDQYNVLSNQLDTVQVRSGVVQEDPAESPAEDKYYCTTRVHRLVPVEKPIISHFSDHLYQALDEPNKKKQWCGSKVNEHIQNRHNTFTASTTTPENQRSDDSLLRTYSSTAQTLEKLDPMYDEPYKPLRSSSLSKVNIYNVDPLFDDPKYDTKESTLAGSSCMLDDSTHTTKAAASDSRTVSQATNRHVSFSTDTTLGVGVSPIKKSASVVGKIYLSV